MMKLLAMFLIILFIAGSSSFCMSKAPDTKKAGSMEAAAKNQNKKFTTDKNQVKQTKQLQQLENEMTIEKNNKNAPMQSPDDAHPSTQF